MGYNDSLDIGKELKKRKSEEKGEAKSANDLFKTAKEPNVKVKTVTHDRAEAIAEAQETPEIDNVNFEKPRKREKVKLGPMILGRRERIEKFICIEVLIMFASLIIFKSGNLSYIDSQVDKSVRQQLSDQTLINLKQQYPLASPIDLAKKANQILLPLSQGEEFSKLKADTAQKYKDEFKWPDGTPYLFTPEAWAFINEYDINPQTAYLWFGVLSIIIVLMVFFACAMITKSYYAAFVSAIIFLLMPSVLDAISAGSGGIAEISILAGILIIIGFIGFFAGKIKYTWLIPLFAGIILSIHLHTWIHWLFAAIAGIILIYASKLSKRITALAWIASAGIFTFIFWYARSRPNIWPSELFYLIDPRSVIGAIGGYAILLIAFAGLWLLIFKEDEYPRQLIFIAGAFASLLGSAFSSISTLSSAALVAAILIAVLMERIIAKAPEWFDFMNFKILKENSKITWSFIFVLIAVLIMWHGVSAISSNIPIINDATVNAAGQLAGNNIIFSWDGNENAISYFANVKTLGSATANSKEAVLLSRALTEADEAKTIDSLRLLSCGLNEAFSKLKESDTRKWYILQNIIHKDKQSAAKWLADNNQPDITDITHCQPSNAAIVVSDETMQQLDEIFSLSSWTPAIHEFTDQQKIADEAMMTKDEAVKLFTPTYHDLTVSNNFNCVETNSTILCDKLEINKETLEIQNPPFAGIIIVGDEVKHKDYADAKGPLQLIITKTSKDQYVGRAVDPDAINFQAVKLWAGIGTKYFEPIFLNTEQGRIVAYKIHWNAGANIVLSPELIKTEESNPAIDSLILQQSKKAELKNKLTQSLN